MNWKKNEYVTYKIYNSISNFKLFYFITLNAYDNIKKKLILVLNICFNLHTLQIQSYSSLSLISILMSI